MLRFASEQSANEIEEDKEAAMNQQVSYAKPTCDDASWWSDMVILQQVLEHLDNLLIEPTTGPEPFEEGQFSD